MKRLNYFPVFVFALIAYYHASAQERDNLGDQTYVIIKDYKPVLAESYKISDTPKGDTTTAAPVRMEYSLEPRKKETTFETGVIKPVKIKDEPLSKQYPGLVKLGIGNYSTYYGELYYNSILSKTGQYGLHLGHLSGQPEINKNVADFSHNAADAYGKYFLDNATVTGTAGFDRHVLHYYGLGSEDTVAAENSTYQEFKHFTIGAGIKSNWLSNDHIDYNVNIGFHNLSDWYKISESDFNLSAQVGKKINANYFSLLSSFNFFKKTDSRYRPLDLYSDLSRNIVNFQPMMTMNTDKVHLQLGFDVAFDKNLGTETHIFPEVEISVPVSENILWVYANVTGNLQKNSFRTITDENPFTSSSAGIYKNTANKIIADGGVRGSFSSQLSFLAALRYSMVDNMAFFYNDSLQPNKFNILYDNGKVMDIHAELTYRQNEKVNISLHGDQYAYTMDTVLKPWHKPMTEVSLVAKYCLTDNITLNAALIARGNEYARMVKDSVFTSQKISGFMDANFGAEYHYTKFLSFYLNLNNVSFSSYNRWYNYPTEQFNVLGGLTYSF